MPSAACAEVSNADAIEEACESSASLLSDELIDGSRVLLVSRVEFSAELSVALASAAMAAGVSCGAAIQQSAVSAVHEMPLRS